MSRFFYRLFRPFDDKANKGVTVPPMDGALKPNQSLETASTILFHDRPDNLARDGNKLLFSSGLVLNCVEIGSSSETVTEIERFQCEITALACDGLGGYVVGLDSGEIIFGGTLKAHSLLKVDIPLAPTALALSDHGRLYVCSGSLTNRPSQWKRDLMERNESGSVWEFDLATGHGVCLAKGLAFPYGVALAGGESAIVVSESWKHRILLIGTDHSKTCEEPQVVLDDLPGYPARIVAGANGYWLAVFAPRGQLIEFVLQEDDYRKQMMQNIKPEFWMAPALTSGRKFLEPLQLGAIRTMGTIKPWAPTRSYGLLVHLDSRYQPTSSAHSRSDGTRHGITSCLHWEDRVLAASKGGDIVVSIGINELSGN